MMSFRCRIIPNYGGMQLYRRRLWARVLIMSLCLAGVQLLPLLGLYHWATFVKGILDRVRPERSVEGEESCIVQDGDGVEITLRRMRLHWCQTLHFLERPGPVVALASFAGSGNTWVRYLLQQATGVLTGSVYNDCVLLNNGFPAESVVNGSVSVVKTHGWGPDARKPFHKAVLLVRAPGAAIQAEFNRKNGGHIGYASPDHYKRRKGKDWKKFVTVKLTSWRYTNLDWLLNFTGPIHVMFYEDMLRDVERQLRALLHFLDIRVTKSELACALKRQEGIYRRKRRIITFDPFSGAMKAAIAKEQEEVYSVIRSSRSPPVR